MTAMPLFTPVPDYSAIKIKQNAAWSSGDYARIGTTLQIVGETSRRQPLGSIDEHHGQCY